MNHTRPMTCRGQHVLTIVPLAALALAATLTAAANWRSTRITDPDQHACRDPGGYPYRARSEMILAELDLQPGDVVVDIGAGDGFWAEKMAQQVGTEGIVHAGEVEQRLVDRLKERSADLPQFKPYLCPMDGTGLPEDSCDLAFLSQTWHHIDADGHVEYLKHLASVVKPTGRLCIIERYTALSARASSHGTLISQLTAQAEQTGWILLRYELIPQTHHYLAIFAQKDLFGRDSR